MKIVALAGGVGGAKLAHGLARVLPPNQLTIVVNTGDDFDHFGLKICPDLDTVCYTLAGLAGPDTGWGRADETWQVMHSVETLGGPGWFRLGDRDLATHLERTRLLAEGLTLSEVTRRLCGAWGIQPVILPMSDQAVPTIVQTDQGDLPFQEYFVHRHCEPVVKGFEFIGAQHARPAAGVMEALEQTDAVVICPSNPWVSIGPILAIAEIRRLVQAKPAIAVSPIIGGVAVKGPAAKMYAELGIKPSAAAVAAQYRGLIDGLVIDEVDAELRSEIALLAGRAFITRTLMKTADDRQRLAQDVIDFIGTILQ